MRACSKRLDWLWLGFRWEGLTLSQSQLAGSDRDDDASVQGVMGRRIADATGKTKMRANEVVRSTKAALRFVTQPSRTSRRYSAVVTRQSLLGSPGPGLILAAGTRRTRSRVFMFTDDFSYLRNLVRERNSGAIHREGSLHSHATTGRVALALGSSTGNQA